MVLGFRWTKVTYGEKVYQDHTVTHSYWTTDGHGVLPDPFE